jgi:hypothetical protein
MIGPVAGAGESMPRSTEYVSWEFSRGLPGLRVEGSLRRRHVGVRRQVQGLRT